jgi:hypothetical protein
MERNRKNLIVDVKQKGAALVTVILVSLLLGTACIAMLTAVGASSRNNTDVLAESKAYYAAESGLQATINVLRNDPAMVDYSVPLAQQAAGTFPVTGPVTINGDTSYSIHISDPDNARTSTQYTSAGFFSTTATGPWETTKYFPNSTDPNRTELTFLPPTGAPVTFNHPDTAPFPELGRFQITRFGTGGAMTTVLFKINYQMLRPTMGIRSIRGSIVIAGGSPYVRFSPFTYSLSGGSINLCSDSSCAVSGVAFADIPLASTGNGTTSVYAKIAPLAPNRLLVEATGIGPNGAKKKLEAILQRNFFGNAGPGSPITLPGPNANFQPGTSAQVEINGGTAPSVGVCDTTSLNTVTTAHTNGTMSPPPAITCDENPSWLSGPIALDAVIRQLRQAAQNSGRYFSNGGPTAAQGWGNFTAGTGLTFCEGSCTLGGNTEGGGILVVTGTLFTSGNPKFKGLVLAVGPNVSSTNPGGIQRNGGGNEVFIGNLVIAPYDPNNLTANFTMSPQYIQNGGPGDTINSDYDANDTFNGTGAITDFMLGIAEK